MSVTRNEDAPRAKRYSESGSSAQPSNSTDRIDLVLVDDHPTVRDALRSVAENMMGIEVVAETGSAGEAQQLVEENSPDVVVLDLSLDDGYAFELLDNLQDQFPEIRVLIFSMYDERVYAHRAFQAGASGYLMKAAPAKEVLQAARHVHNGGVYLSDEMTKRVLKKMVEDQSEEARFPVGELTDRELQVFRMLGQGLTLSEIADRLDLARKTVETHQRRAREKLGYETAAEVLAHAAQWVLGQPKEVRQEASFSPSG